VSGEPSAPAGNQRSSRTSHSLAQALSVIATVALLGAAAVFIVGVCTKWGQQFGDSAYAGRLLSSTQLRQRANDVLGTLRASSVVVFGIVILATALFRKRFRLAVVVAGVMFVAIVGGEFLKHFLPRPNFGVDPPGMTANWAPSGHATVAITMVLCALMVVPTRSRTALSIVGAIYAAAVTSGTLAAGWHRPSDAVMAAFWSFSIATFGLAILAVQVKNGTSDGSYVIDESSRLHRTVLVLAFVLPIALLFWSYASVHDPIDWTQPSGRFVVASVVTDASAAAAVLLFAWLLRGLPGDRRVPIAVAIGE